MQLENDKTIITKLNYNTYTIGGLIAKLRSLPDKLWIKRTEFSGLHKALKSNFAKT